MGQTTVQDDDSVLFGSAKIELGLYSAGIGAVTDIGAANGVKFQFSPKSTTISFDNTEEWKRFADSAEATITGTLFEVNGDNVAKLLSGASVKTPVAANPVAVTDESITLTLTGAKRLAKKNGAGTEVSTIVVTDSTGAVTYDRAGHAAAGDYVIGVDVDGYTTIARSAAASTITTGETVFVDYSYTPNASVTVDVGGITAQDYLIARLTNVRPSDSKAYTIICHKVALAGDMTWSYGADGDLKPIGMPITLKAIKDLTKANKYQLFQIVDEQSVV